MALTRIPPPPELALAVAVLPVTLTSVANRPLGANPLVSMPPPSPPELLPLTTTWLSVNELLLRIPPPAALDPTAVLSLTVELLSVRVPVLSIPPPLPLATFPVTTTSVKLPVEFDAIPPPGAFPGLPLVIVKPDIVTEIGADS